MISISRKIFFRELREVLLLLVVGLIMTIAFGYTRDVNQFLIVGSFGASMWIFLWKGNSYLSHGLKGYINWLESPLRTFLVGMLATLVYTVGIVFLLVKIFEGLFSVNFGDITYMLYSTVAVTLMITFFMNGRSFLMSWKEAAIDAERLKQENMAARYESLKNQVNPHFLFNSLNALTNLVYENQDMAAQFIKQLSEVYRYVLDTRHRELVPKEEETKFLESYLFLQKIRFGDNLKVDIQLDSVDTAFPPLVLQMLIENAIKHNVVTSEMPLEIKVHSDGSYIIVENNLQKKKGLPEESAGIGLSNISARYEFLSGKNIEVTETPDKFIVKLPLIFPHNA